MFVVVGFGLTVVALEIEIRFDLAYFLFCRCSEFYFFALLYISVQLLLDRLMGQYCFAH